MATKSKAYAFSEKQMGEAMRQVVNGFVDELNGMNDMYDPLEALGPEEIYIVSYEYMWAAMDRFIKNKSWKRYLQS